MYILQWLNAWPKWFEIQQFDLTLNQSDSTLNQFDSILNQSDSILDQSDLILNQSDSILHQSDSDIHFSTQHLTKPTRHLTNSTRYLTNPTRYSQCLLDTKHSTKRNPLRVGWYVLRSFPCILLDLALFNKLKWCPLWFWLNSESIRPLKSLPMTPGSWAISEN